MKQHNRTPQNSWYLLSSRPKVQLGLYNFFVIKKKIPIEVIKECIEEFVIKFELKNQTKKTVLETLTRDCNFGTFLKIVTNKTGVNFKNNPHKKHHKRKRNLSYDEWWQQSNLDGSFAYNGVTDDF